MIFIMAGLNGRGLQSKLLITPLSEWSHNIIILQVWCSLKSVTTTLCLLFSWLHILHCTVVIILGNLASIPSYSCLVYMMLWLCSFITDYIYTCINVTCAGTRLYRYTSDFWRGLIQLSFIPVCWPNTCNISVKLCRGLHFSAFHYDIFLGLLLYSLNILFYCYYSDIFLLLFSNYAPKNLNSQTLTMNAIIKNIK